jgi:hypothetical protein
MEDKTVPGLNELTAEEYYEDYKLYLEHCDMPDQRNLTTYFAEFEHQEGEISWVTKMETAALVARWVMEPLEVELISMVNTVYEWVLQSVQHGGNFSQTSHAIFDFSQSKPIKHEVLVAYVKHYMDALKRGIDEYL